MVEPSTVWQALGQVNDPEFPLSIVDLGMVYDVEVKDEGVRITMTFTSIGCPAIEMIISDMKAAVCKLEGIEDVEVDVVWSPAWSRERITERGRQILSCYGVMN